MSSLNQVKAAGFSNLYRGKSAARASLLSDHLKAILNHPENYVEVVPSQIESALRKQMMSNNQKKRLSSLSPAKRKYFTQIGIAQNLRTRANNARKESRHVMNEHIHNLSSVLMRLQTNEKTQRKLLTAEKLARSHDPSNRELLSLYRQIQQAKSLLAIEEFNAFHDPRLIAGPSVNRLKELKLLNESNNAVLRPRPRAAVAQGRAAARGAGAKLKK
jgi:hypothetical protein